MMNNLLVPNSPQLDLVPREEISLVDIANIQNAIRRSYWHIRQLRGGKFAQAALRKHYRQVEKLKDRLMVAGVEKRDILDFIACCRLSCCATKQPFLPCRFCRAF